MLGVGRDRESRPTACTERCDTHSSSSAHKPRWLQGWRTTTSSLGNLCHCLTALVGKHTSPLSSLTPPLSLMKLFPLIPPYFAASHFPPYAASSPPPPCKKPTKKPTPFWMKAFHKVLLFSPSFSHSHTHTHTHTPRPPLTVGWGSGAVRAAWVGWAGQRRAGKHREWFRDGYTPITPPSPM